ncbi:MAG: nucleoside-diphosphate sugar epimerase/dehydratase [Clostridia bacterium]
MSFKKFIYLILDIPVVVISVVIAAMLRFDFTLPTEYYAYIIEFIPIATVSTIFFGLIFGSYNNMLSYFGFSEIFKQFVVSMSVGAVFLVLKISETMNFPGSITIMYCGIFFAFSSAIRGIPRFQRYLMSLTAVRQGTSKKVLIIGAGKAGAMVIKQFVDNKQDGFFPVGILDDDKSKHGQKIAGVKVLGNIEQASSYAKLLQADEILVAMPSASEQQMMKIFDLVANANLPTRIFQTAVDIQSYKSGDKRALKEISIEDLLFRDSIKTDNSLNREFIWGKTVIVTGGAGSIGSELCRQIIKNGAKFLIIFDINENGLFELNEELKGEFEWKYITCLGSVRDVKRLKAVFNTYKPDLVFHAAAHKHVPMMEINPFEAVKNNVLGTRNVIECAVEFKSKKFTLISTDKAVNPTNVMGATKRICELLVKAYSNQNTEMVAVRFGNVLGSNGSVIPLFKKQIAAGGPVTVTHKDMTRYFMTIPEAVSLVLSAGASAKGSELFVLDMGQPVKIYDLAVNLIRLSGLRPFEDIDIKEVGLRPGEKMYEELKLGTEVVDKTSHKKIFVMKDEGVGKERVADSINKLTKLANEQKDEQLLRDTLFDLIKDKETV